MLNSSLDQNENTLLGAKTMAGNTVDVNDANFDSEVIKSKSPVLVDFWAPWCGPCVAIGPVLDDLAREFQGKVKVTKMNVDENAHVPAQFGVRSIPYMVMFKDGQVIDSIVGAVPKNKLKDLFEKSI